LRDNGLNAYRNCIIARLVLIINYLL